MVVILPRVIRAKDAPKYLGIDKNKFNQIIKPKIISVPLGLHSVGYDRLDLDAVWDQYKTLHGRPGAELLEMKGIQQWPKELPPASSFAQVSGISTKSSMGREYARALEQAIGKKPRQS